MDSMLEFWAELEKQKKMMVILAILVVILLSLGAAFFLRTQYAVLFNQLSDEDAARISEQLDEMKMPYRFDSSNSAILVESDKVYSTRLALTAKGALIKGGVGFELFDKTEYGMTEFSQKINFQRALQGELTRTILAIESIEQARVHLSFPESRLFENEKSYPKASVTIKLKKGYKVGQDTIKGIQYLISAAVNELEASSVTILDESGVILSKNIDSDSDQNEFKMKNKESIELYLTQKASAVLGSVFSDGSSSVHIDVSLNYDNIIRKTERLLSIDNDSGILIDKKINSTKKSASFDKASSENKDETVTESQELHYEVGREVENFVSNQGAISRITASVVIPKKISEHSLDSIRDLVGNAIGINYSRGDKIEVAILEELSKKSVIPMTENGDQVNVLTDGTKENNENLKSKIVIFFKNKIALIFSIVGALFLFLNIILFFIFFKKKNLSKKERELLLAEIRSQLSI